MTLARLLIPPAIAVTLATVPPVMADDPVIYDLTLRNHAFEPSELKVPAGKPFKIKFRNTNSAPAELESKLLKIEKVVAGSTEATVNVRALDPGRYEFYDEFHEDEAKGVVVAE
ncbi:MAG: cupredoxin domain-containing protein [Hyphomicrobiales bacterium]